MKSCIKYIPNEGTLKFVKYSENFMIAAPPYLSLAVIEPGTAAYIFLSTENMTFKIFKNVEGHLIPLNFWINGFMTTNILYSNLSQIAKFSPILRGFVDLMDSQSCSELQQKEISGEIPLETQVKNRIKEIAEIVKEEFSEDAKEEKLYTHWFNDNYVILTHEENPAKLVMSDVKAIFLGCDNDSFSILEMNHTTGYLEETFSFDNFRDLIQFAKEYPLIRKLVLATKNLLLPETMQELQEIEENSNG